MESMNDIDMQEGRLTGTLAIGVQMSSTTTDNFCFVFGLVLFFNISTFLFNH